MKTACVQGREGRFVIVRQGNKNVRLRPIDGDRTQAFVVPAKRVHDIIEETPVKQTPLEKIKALTKTLTGDYWQKDQGAYRNDVNKLKRLQTQYHNRA